jgi:regulator of replication initiation timing
MLKKKQLVPAVSVLLQRLLNLSADLDVETELRFQYMEDALLDLSNIVIKNRYATQNAKAMATVQAVMERLRQAFDRKPFVDLYYAGLEM